MIPITGFIKKVIKAAVVITAALSFALFTLIALAVTDSADSSNSPLSDKNNPTLGAPYGAPFILETGYSAVTNWPDNDAIDGSSGAYHFGGCSGSLLLPTGDAETDLPLSKDYYGKGVGDLPYCIATLSTNKLCPSPGFIPVIKVTPVSVTASSTTPIFACLLPGTLDTAGPFHTGVSYNSPSSSGYAARFATPAASTTGATNGAWQPFVSIAWEVWCYPTTQRTGSENANIPVFDECNISKAPTLEPYMLETGTLYGAKGQITSSNSSQNFPTTRHCPFNWKGWVEIDSPTIIGQQSNPENNTYESVGTSGVCVKSVDPDPTGDHYKVTFFAKATSVTMSFNSSLIAIQDPEQVPSLDNAHWTLYCYPPGYIVPKDGSCNDNSSPYE